MKHFLQHSDDVMIRLKFSCLQPRIHHSCRILKILLILCFCVWGGVWYPLHIYEQNIQESILHKKEEILIGMHYRDMNKNYTTLFELVTHIYNRVDHKISQSEVTKDIALLLHKHQINVLKESNEKGDHKSKYQSLHKEIVAKGGYTNIRRFLTNLKESSNYVQIQTIRLSTSEDSPEMVNMILQIIIY